MKKLIGFLLLLLFCSTLNAQKYEFDYLLQYSLEHGNSTYFVNSKNPDFHLQMKGPGDPKAILRDKKNGWVHVYSFVEDAAGNSATFTYEASIKTDYDSKPMSAFEIKEIGKDRYLIASAKPKRLQAKNLVIDIKLKTFSENVVNILTDSDHDSVFYHLISNALPPGSKYIIEESKVKSFNGNVEVKKLMYQEKIEPKLEILPQQLKLFKDWKSFNAMMENQPLSK